MLLIEMLREVIASQIEKWKPLEFHHPPRVRTGGNVISHLLLQTKAAEVTIDVQRPWTTRFP
jgi:hypothetical protein